MYTHSEKIMIKYLIDNVENEAFLVCNTIKDKIGISRGSISNALEKLYVQGVIKKSSMGMKGTYIKILDRDMLIKMG